MTRHDAIKILGQYDVNFYYTEGEPIPAEILTDAFEMAITSLKKWGELWRWLATLDSSVDSEAVLDKVDQIMLDIELGEQV